MTLSSRPIRVLSGVFALAVLGAVMSAPARADEAKKTEKTAKAASLPNMKALKDPKGAEMTKQAPDVFQAKFETTKGDFVVEVKREMSPNGADRFYNLVRNGWYDGVRFFRVIPGFMAQFGINGNPELNATYMNASIPDDPVKGSNTRGMVTFAMRGSPNSRTTQLFINFGDNSGLDKQGFAPFGEVIGEGMTVVDAINGEYGEGAPRGKGPDQGRIQSEGNAYLIKDFPNLDYIRKVTIVE